MRYLHGMKANEKTVNYLRVVLLFPLFLAALSAMAQSKSTPVNSKVDQKPAEPENLMVFQDWIRWNNPGSLRSSFPEARHQSGLTMSEISGVPG